MYISPHSPDDTSSSIVTKFGKVDGSQHVIKCAKFGVDRLRCVGSAGVVKSDPSPVISK